MKIIFKTDEENQNMINEGASTSKIKDASTSKISLNDICYEQIKDNFYYGKFGDFTLVIDKNTGCFNATKLCQLSPKKRFADWTKLSRSQELLDYYNKKNFRLENSPAWNYEIKGNNRTDNSKITGQYVQKELILDIASWISVEFYDKCSKIVNYSPSSQIKPEMDMFEFIKTQNLPILADINKQWFKQLWLPLTMKQIKHERDQIQPPPLGGLKIILIKELFEFLGYEGAIDKQQEKFKALLNRSSIPFQEIAYTSECLNEIIKTEAKTIAPQNLSRKRWIVMDIRSFKKAIMKLNTKKGDEIRDYYLNLEEFAFEYGQYVMERREVEYELKMLKATQDKEKAEQDKEQAVQDKNKEKIAREKAERKALNVKKFMNRITIKEQKLEWIYIGTTRLYAQERLFKIGSTTRLTSRIPQYNTGRPGSSDPFYYAWAIKCYNAKDVDFYIQKLLLDFKFKDPQKVAEEQVKDNRAEMYHGIKFNDLKDILTFIVNNYDQSIEYINNFIKIRLNESLEEEDEIPPALDLKKITYLIGDHEEVIDVEKENEREFKKELKNMMRYFKDQQARGDKTDKVIIVERTELVSRLSQFVGESKTGLWNRIKELTGWKKSTMELVQSESESEESDAFKYKIMYNKTTDR